jgi:hypothetical protein
MNRVPRLALLLVAAFVAAGAIAAPAQARWAERGDQRHRRHDWNGGYRRAPPLIYARPGAVGPYGGYGYVPPPVIYAPSIGLSIGIR